MRYVKRAVLVCGAAALLCWLFSVAAYATGRGDVAGAVESTWAAASGQIKTVVNNVVFPAIDMILAIFFFVKLGTAYFDYSKTSASVPHGMRKRKNGTSPLSMLLPC